MAEKRKPAKNEAKVKKLALDKTTASLTSGVDASQVSEVLSERTGIAPTKKGVSENDSAASDAGTISKERAWKIAQLAAVLASRGEVREGCNRLVVDGARIASPSFDTFYAAALKRAETLLDWAEGQWGEVHAYQFFDEGRICTETEIFKAFANIRWDRLASKQPVMDLMASTREKFDEEIELYGSLDQLGNSETLLQLLRDLEMSVDSTLKGWLGEREHVTAYCDSVREAMRQILWRCAEGVQTQFPKAVATEILGAITAHPRADQPEGAADIQAVERFIAELKTSFAEQIHSFFPSGAGLERVHVQNEREYFRAWCFPQGREGSKAERAYRPYEIFLHCAANRWYNDKLIRNSGSLKFRSIPSPPVDLRNPSFAVFAESPRSTI